MNVLLVTRPEHDDTTHYLSNWCKEVLNFAQTKDFEILDLHREKANRNEIESRLKKVNLKFIFLNGHGNERCVTGHKNEPLIILGENENLLKSKTIYALSCKSAKLLGVGSVKAGAICYSGYDDDFIFAFEPEMISRPIHDKTAKLFLEPSNIFVRSILKGNNIQQAEQKMKEELRKNFIASMQGDSKDNDISRFLWWDLNHFVIHGNGESVI